MPIPPIDPLTAGGVTLATAATDAVYVLFTSAIVARRRVPAATWSSIWYLLSSSDHPLHRELALSRLRGGGIVDRGLSVADGPAPAARRPCDRADGRRAAISPALTAT